MTEFTFLKLQFDDASFTANTPFSTSGEAEVEVESETDDEEESGGLFPFLLGLLFLVVLAVVAKKVLGGSGPEPDAE